MKLLFVITGLQTGGAEMMLYKLLSKIDRSSFDCHVFNLRGPGPTQEKIEALGIPVTCFHMDTIVGSVFRLSHLKNQIKALKPDLIHAWMYHAIVLSHLAERWAGLKIPLLWGIRYSLTNLAHDKTSTRLLIKLAACFSDSPKHIIYNAHRSASQHERAGYQPQKTIVIPNGLDTTVWEPNTQARQTMRSELGLPADTPLIGLVGRFDPSKDHKTFIQAAGLMREKQPQTHFVLIGPGLTISNKALTTLISNEKVEKNIHLLGERHDIPLLTAALDIATNCSITESFPNAVLEAMACGVIPVVTDVGDSARIVGEAGKVIPVKNPTALAQAWDEILSQGKKDKEDQSKQACQRVHDFYDLTGIVKKYQDLYR